MLNRLVLTRILTESPDGLDGKGWDMIALSMNPNVTTDLVTKFKHLNWDHLGLFINSSTPSWYQIRLWNKYSDVKSSVLRGYDLSKYEYKRPQVDGTFIDNFFNGLPKNPDSGEAIVQIALHRLKLTPDAAQRISISKYRNHLRKCNLNHSNALIQWALINWQFDDKELLRFTEPRNWNSMTADLALEKYGVDGIHKGLICKTSNPYKWIEMLGELNESETKKLISHSGNVELTRYLVEKFCGLEEDEEPRHYFNYLSDAVIDDEYARELIEHPFVNRGFIMSNPSISPDFIYNFLLDSTDVEVDTELVLDCYYYNENKIERRTVDLFYDSEVKTILLTEGYDDICFSGPEWLLAYVSNIDKLAIMIESHSKIEEYLPTTIQWNGEIDHALLTFISQLESKDYFNWYDLSKRANYELIAQFSDLPWNNHVLSTRDYGRRSPRSSRSNRASTSPIKRVKI